MEIKELECKSCGANMEIDYKKNVLVCPYCGAREIIVDPGKVREPEQKKPVKAKKNKNRKKPNPTPPIKPFHSPLHLHIYQHTNYNKILTTIKKK